MFRACLRQVSTQAGRLPLSISSRVADGVFVHADREKMHQVLLNLILNAIEASGKHGTVWVRLTADRRANRASIVVEDNGPGIDEADLPRVLEPFFTTKSSGSGLGLAIVKTIIEEHNGRLLLGNRPEGGLRAEVELNLLREH